MTKVQVARRWLVVAGIVLPIVGIAGVAALYYLAPEAQFTEYVALIALVVLGIDAFIVRIFLPPIATRAPRARIRYSVILGAVMAVLSALAVLVIAVAVVVTFLAVNCQPPTGC